MAKEQLESNLKKYIQEKHKPNDKEINTLLWTGLSVLVGAVIPSAMIGIMFKNYTDNDHTNYKIKAEENLRDYAYDQQLSGQKIVLGNVQIKPELKELIQTTSNYKTVIDDSHLSYLENQKNNIFKKLKQNLYKATGLFGIAGAFFWGNLELIDEGKNLSTRMPTKIASRAAGVGGVYFLYGAFENYLKFRQKRQNFANFQEKLQTEKSKANISNISQRA